MIFNIIAIQLFKLALTKKWPTMDVWEEGDLSVWHYKHKKIQGFDYFPTISNFEIYLKDGRGFEIDEGKLISKINHGDRFEEIVERIAILKDQIAGLNETK